MTTTAANVHDVSEAHRLLHGGESQVRGDAGYRGAGKRQVAMRPGQRRKPDPGSGEALAERNKASIRAKSLPSTAIGGGAPLPESEAGVRVRQEPDLAKAGVRYRGLAKNTQRPALLLRLGNLLTVEGRLAG